MNVQHTGIPNNMQSNGVEIKKTNSLKNYHESKILMLNSDKSKKMLNWQAKYNLEQIIKLTSSWFKEFFAKKNILNVTQNQIINYFD